MNVLPDFKRGDTFCLGCLKQDSDGVPEDLSAVTIAAQVRDVAGRLLADLNCTQADQNSNPGEFSLDASSAITATWPVGTAQLDIEFGIGSDVISTETLRFRIKRDVTHD